MARRKRLTPPTPLPDPPREPLEPQAMPSSPASAHAAVAKQGSFSTSPMAPVARVAGDQSQAAALRELSEEMIRARESGRMVLELPLDAIEAEHLIRDRLLANDDEMQSLKDSLAHSGQRTPVEVLELGAGRYGLISGWRRIAALRALTEEGRADGVVLAMVRQPEDQASAYRAMVEENEIRADLSYYERARIVAKAVEAGVFETERDALQSLFGAASRARRSKIGSFLPIVRDLDEVLGYPSAIPERLGLKLSQRLREDQGFVETLRSRLKQAGETLEDERSVLETAISIRQSPRTAAKPDPLREEGARQIEEPVSLSRDRQGRLILDGPGVTSEFETRLKSWIEAQS